MEFNAPSTVDVPGIIPLQCTVGGKWLVASLVVLGERVNTVFGKEVNGSYSATISKNVSVSGKLHDTMYFECVVTWVLGDHNQTITNKRKVKLECEYNIKYTLKRFIIWPGQSKKHINKFFRPHNQSWINKLGYYDNCCNYGMQHYGIDWCGCGRYFLNETMQK